MMRESTLTRTPWLGRLHWPGPSWQRALKTPLVVALAVALVAQLLMALMAGRGAGMAPAEMDAVLLDFDADAVIAIEIQDGDGKMLRLVRNGDGWQLPDLSDSPASANRVSQLIDTLAGLTRPLPVATSADARTRFKVADDGFERRLILRGEGGDIATLLIGDSPGFRRLFARVAGEDAVYDLRMALFDLSVSADDWMELERAETPLGQHGDTDQAAAPTVQMGLPESEPQPASPGPEPVSESLSEPPTDTASAATEGN